MSYRELQLKVEQLASYLRQRNVGPESTVAVCLERSFDSVVASLAAMRAGAAYVPLDVAWPDDRLRYVVQDSQAAVLVSCADILNRLGLDVIGVDPCRDAAIITAAEVLSASAEIASDSLAYVMYTSGSTGRPKGVEITHGNLSHLIAWHCETFSVTHADRASHLAGLGFDAAAWEVWPYLAAGASVSLADETVRTSPEMLQRWLIGEGITISFVPTALAGPLVALPWPERTTLRTLLTGGDTLHKGPPAALPFAFVNNYGPTECSVVATSGVVQHGADAVPTIGWPIKGTSVHVLDDLGRRVPAGQTGEICIGGSGVGRGYRNLPELTEGKFVLDPFSRITGARMYRTGDQGALLPDGQIVFKGRLDGQEKIRGQRLELDEVSSVLNRHPDVAWGVVTSNQEIQAEKVLIAYVLPAEGTKPSSPDLQAFLSESLPAYMIPSVFVRIESIPLTSSGKVDRSALPAVTEANTLSRRISREALSPIEETLITTVRELLGTQAVTIEDDFFLIGGHSLLGTQLVLRIRDAFGIEFTLRDLFEAVTVERLAARVESKLIQQLEELTEEEALRQAGL